MFWLILVIIIVGYFVVKAIQRNTYTNALIAQQQIENQRLERENSPAYQAQQRASLDYFHYLGDVLEAQIRIAEHKIRLYNPPKFKAIWTDKSGKMLNKTRYITFDKQVFDENKKNGSDIQLVEKAKFLQYIKDDIASDKELIKELEKEYKQKQTEYPGIKPEPIEVSKSKYELDVPFAPDYERDYFNEDNTSSWSMFTDNKAKLRGLEATLQKLSDPKTRKSTIESLNKGNTSIDGNVLSDDELFKAAVSVVLENNKASTSLLQRRLRIGYGRAATLIEEMEQRGIIGAADGARPRAVLMSEAEINKLVS